MRLFIKNIKIQLRVYIQLINKVFDLFFWIGIVCVLWFVTQVFLIASFKIPSNSMEPELTTGDNILVWKPIIGPRIFNIFASLQNKQTVIQRISGIRKVQRNDILVFNYPFPNSWSKVEMHIFKYYIKRCIGIPGDTLSIQNGFFQLGGIHAALGNIDSQKEIASTEKFPKDILWCFPFDSIMGWNIKNFGPLYIPGAGDSLVMNRTNFRIYKKLIEWEQKKKLKYKDSIVYINGIPIEGYRFQKNYYFMAGDKGLNSQDSRYWGLLPEEYIVGKAWIIWKSIDPYTGKFRWERFLKVIH